jgi:phosphate-selective porin OprO/OprP
MLGVRIGRPRFRGRLGLVALMAVVAGPGPSAKAEEPPAVPATPPAEATAAPAPSAEPSAREAVLEDRLRKMEEANEEFRKQFAEMAKQNAALNRTVQDLSRKLEAASRPPAGGAGGAPATAGGTTGRLTTGNPVRDAPDIGPGGPETNVTRQPITGGIGFPLTGPGTEPERDRVPLRAYNALSYRNRYGFVLQSENEEFELRVNGLAQLDSRMYSQHNQVPVINDLDMPRIRLYFSGRLTKRVEYQLSFQRSTNSLDILNAYVNLHLDDRFQIRAGRYRAPYTYEWAKLSIWEMPTPERSPFAANFGPNRQVGLMAWGNVLQDRLEYASGIFGGPRNSFQDTNSAKDIMSFVDIRPFYRPDSDSPLKFLSVGGSLDAGLQDNPAAPELLRGTTTASTNTLTTTNGDTIIAIPFLAFNSNVRERGQRALWELHATYFYKSLALLAAWDSGHNDFSLITPGAQPVHLPVSGYLVQVSYMLTGEERDKITLVNPLRPFSLKRGQFGPGAIELQTRYSELAVGRSVFTGGLADPNLWTNVASFVDLGVNWYPNRYLKFYFDWQHAMFGQPVVYRPGGFQSTSDLYWLRLQLYF